MSVFGPVPSLDDYNGFFYRAFASYRANLIYALAMFWLVVLMGAALLAMGVYYVHQSSRSVRWRRRRSVGIWLIIAAVVSSAMTLPMAYSDVQFWAEYVFDMLA